MARIEIEGVKRRPYPEGEEPKRVAANIPEWLETALSKTFVLGNHGSGKKSYLVALGLALVLYGVGCKSVSVWGTAAAITRLFPGDSERINWAARLRLLADQLSAGATETPQ